MSYRNFMHFVLFSVYALHTAPKPNLRPKIFLLKLSVFSRYLSQNRNRRFTTEFVMKMCVLLFFSRLSSEYFRRSYKHHFLKAVKLSLKYLKTRHFTKKGIGLEQYQCRWLIRIRPCQLIPHINKQKGNDLHQCSIQINWLIVCV